MYEQEEQKQRLERAALGRGIATTKSNKPLQIQESMRRLHQACERLENLVGELVGEDRPKDSSNEEEPSMLFMDMYQSIGPCMDRAAERIHRDIERLQSILF